MTPTLKRLAALAIALWFTTANALAQTGWGQGFIPEFHQSDPNAPYVLLPPYTPPNNGIGALTQYRTLIAQAPIALTDNGPTMQLTLDLTKVPINLGGTNGTTQQEAVNNVLGFTGVSLGDLAKYDGSNWVRFPKGTANQVLKMDGAGSDFAWTNQGSIINANAEFIVSAPDGSMPNADVLTGGTGITVTNGTNTSTVAINSSVVTLTGSQILTNKTLTSPVFSWNGGAGVTLNSSGATTAALTWADWLGNRIITIPDPGTTSSTEVVLGRGTQTLNGTYTFANAPKLSTNTLTSSTGNTITFPNAADTVALLTANQTLTNKTLTAPQITNASTLTFLQTGGNYVINTANPVATRTYTLYDANGNGDIAIKSGSPAAGSVAYGNGNLIAFTGVGTTGQALVSQSTSAPTFGTLDLRGGGLGLTALASGSFIVGNGTNTVGTLAKGTANQYLQMDGTGTNPTWTTPTFGTVTNVSVGNLSPLFTASVSNPTTAPSVSYSLTAAPAGSLFGNFGSISGSPSYNLPGSSNQVLGVVAGGGLEYKTVTPGRNVNVVHSTGVITLKATSPSTQGCRVSLDRLSPAPMEIAGANLYLIPSAHARISLFTSNNEWLEDLVDVTNPPTVSVPSTTNTTYDVYASDTAGNGTITIGTNAWNTAGTVTDYSMTTSATAPEYPCLGPDGNVWLCESAVGVGKIAKVTPSGTVTEYALSSSSANPNAICVGPDGNLWFTESGANKIGKMTTSGSLTEYAITTASAGAFGICVGADGNLWFAEGGVNKIAKITTSGTITEYTVTTASSTPQTVCLGPDGNVWFCETATNKVGKVTPSGTFTEYTIPTASSTPFGIVTGPDGNVWFCETASGANKIAKVTPNGAFTEYAITSATSTPRGICVGPDGNIWFAEQGTSKIGQMTMSGVCTEYSATASCQPAGICTGADNLLWYGQVGVGVNKVGKLTADAPPTRGQQDGVWWTGNNNQRLIACIRTGSTSGIVPDNSTQRFLFNWDNQIDSHLRGQQTASTWTYASTTTRNANGNMTDGQGRVSLLIGRPTVTSAAYNCGFVATSTNASVGISLDGVQNTAQRTGLQQTGLGSYNGISATQQALVYPGLHFFQAIESCISAATVTFYGTNALPATNASPYGLSSLLTVESKR